MPLQEQQFLQEARALCLALMRYGLIQKTCPDSIVDIIGVRYLQLDESIRAFKEGWERDMATPISLGRSLQSIIQGNPYISAGRDGIEFTCSIAGLELEAHCPSYPDSALSKKDLPSKVETGESRPYQSGHSKGPAQLTSMSSGIKAEQFDLTRRRKVIKNAILNGATLMLQDSKHDLHEDPELDQKMFTHAGYSGRSRSEILSDYNRVLEAYHQYGVLHKPSPDVHKAILSKLLDQVTKRERYTRLENKFGRSNIFQDLLDATDPKMLALYEKGSFELEQLKQLEDQAKIVAYTFSRCYLHVIMHLDMPAMWQLYYGAAISVIKRLCDHMNSRYDKKTLHYFAWNQPKTKDLRLLLGGFKDLLHRYQGNDLNLMLNLFEKFHGLMHQVFAPCMLQEWLPGDIDIRREKLQALTAAEADEIDDNFNDLAESAHPLTCAYAKFLRRKQEIHTKNLGRRLKPSEYQIIKSTAARRQRIDPAKAAHWRDADESMGDEIKVYTICPGCLKQKFRNTNQPVLEERIDLTPLYTVQGSIYVARVITCRLCNSCRLHIPTQANKPFIRMSSIAKIDSTPDDSETFDMLQILEQEDLDYETQR